jgi:hypothetical protein
MVIWLPLVLALIAATFAIAGGLAYILVTFSRAGPLLGARLGAAELQVIKVSADVPPARRRSRRAASPLRIATLPA